MSEVDTGALFKEAFDVMMMEGSPGKVFEIETIATADDGELISESVRIILIRDQSVANAITNVLDVIYDHVPPT